ncbi:MAG: hypothetical protein AAF518_19980 [Spirochaetota bacterium]
MITAKFTKLKFLFTLSYCLIYINSCASVVMKTSGSIVGSVIDIYGKYYRECTFSDIITIYFSKDGHKKLTARDNTEKSIAAVGPPIDVIGIAPYIVYMDPTITGAAKALVYLIGIRNFVGTGGNYYSFEQPFYYWKYYEPESGEWFQSDKEQKYCSNEKDFFVIATEQKSNISQKELTPEICEKFVEENFASIIAKYPEQLVHPIREKQVFQCWHYPGNYLRLGILLHVPNP